MVSRLRRDVLWGKNLGYQLLPDKLSVDGRDRFVWFVLVHKVYPHGITAAATPQFPPPLTDTKSRIS
jgi:hypothetical protein